MKIKLNLKGLWANFRKGELKEWWVNRLWSWGLTLKYTKMHCDGCQRVVLVRNADCEIYFCKDCWSEYRDECPEEISPFYDIKSSPETLAEK
jgi:hypothetical protein